MKCFNGIIYIYRAIILYVLFDLLYNSNYIKFGLLFFNVLCDVMSTFCYNISGIFLIFAIAESLNIIHTASLESFLIFFYNFLLFLFYLQDDTEEKQTYFLKSYLEQLENCQDENNECFICLDNYLERKNLKVLPCSHYFHPECILEWLKTTDDLVCPVCKQQIIQTDETLLL